MAYFGEDLLARVSHCGGIDGRIVIQIKKLPTNCEEGLICIGNLDRLVHTAGGQAFNNTRRCKGCNVGG